MKAFPEKPLGINEILAKINDYLKDDNDPASGRMWSHVYALDLPKEVIEVGKRLYEMFLDKTMLDITAYPSIIKMENDIIAMTRSLLGGNEETVGLFTYGGTESIMMAAKAAREYFFKVKGDKSVIPEIVLPVTAHPAFHKAANFLGMKVVPVRIGEDMGVDMEELKNSISSRTAMIVGSAPNYPFGTMDDIKALSDIAQDKGVWLHVDACIGGYLLPFLRELGEPIPPFDLSLEGVISISADLHKYGYAFRGASVVLFRNDEYREGAIFVMSKWPGYPLVNTAVLSTRSAAPLAAAWGIMQALGREGYRKLASRILYTKRKLLDGLKRMGYRVIGNPVGGTIAFTSDEINIAELPSRLKGWFVQYQPGSRELGFPKSIHMTIAPGHDKVIDSFLEDLERATNELKKGREGRVDLSSLISNITNVSSLFNLLRMERGKLPSNLTLINELMYEAPPDFVESVLKFAINKYIYKPS